MLRRAEMTERFPVLCQEPGSPRLPSLPPFLPPTPSRTHWHVLLRDGPTAPLPAQGRHLSCPPRLLPWPGGCATGPTHRAQLLGRSRARWVCVGQRGRSWADGALWRWEQSPSPEPVSGHLTHPTQLSPRRARSRGLESQGPARSPQRSPKALGAHGLGAVPGALPIFCFLTRFSARPE